MNLLTTADTASRLSITKKALENLRHRGIGPECVIISARCVRYSEQALTKWVASRSHTGATGSTADK